MRYLCILALLCGCSSKPAEPKAPPLTPLEKVEAFAAAASPKDCAAVKVAAKALRGELKGLDFKALGKQDQERLDAVGVKLKPVIDGCTVGPKAHKAVPSGCEDAPQHIIDSCTGPDVGCPLGGWTCFGFYMGCIAGDDNACCWTGMCHGGYDGCVLACCSSCVCNGCDPR
jgi:hypothetical protein